MKYSVSYLQSRVSEFTSSMLYLVSGPLIASGVLAGLLFALTEYTSAKEWSWLIWIALAPAIYTAWLILLMLVYASDVQARRFLLGYEKAARAANNESFRGWLNFYLSMSLYLRVRFLRELPLVEGFLGVPIIRHLVLLSYANRTRLGPNSMALGYFFDPDLTDLGADAIVGACTSVVAHSLTCTPDGNRLLVTAEVTIGPRAVVGGDGHIGPGVKIGADALVEPGSYVVAFTQIGPGEIWGGNPARFLRMRFPTSDQQPAAPTNSVTIDEATELALREIVATELNRSVEAITPDLHARDCAAWDSLAQLGMSLALQQRFGITLNQQEAFRLRSMRDLRDVLQRR